MSSIQLKEMAEFYNEPRFAEATDGVFHSFISLMIL
jgi:hypothetical protein